MYNVSENYLAAMRERVRSDRVTGSIGLADGTVIGISDEVLVRGTLRLTRELCSGKYRIGTFDLACLRFSFFIDNALGLELAGATVSLSYELELSAPGGSGENEETASRESVPLGTFFIDPVQSSRRKNILSVVAYDAGVLFDREPSETLRDFTGTAPELIAAVCSECGVLTDVTAEGLSGLPNSDVTVSVKDKQIQSCRDIVMWCAALMCSYAVVGRDSTLRIIPPKYDVETEDTSVIVTDRDIMEDERESIYVTDTRAYIKYLTAYVGSSVVSYTHEYTSTDAQAAPAAYVLEKNPLLAGSGDEVYSAVNQAWLGYIHAFKQRGVQARIWGDPAIDVGDTVLFGGGDVDQRGGIIGVVTRVDWKYRGYTDIECLAAECVGALNGSSVPAGSAAVRKQSDKRIDGLSDTGGSGGGKDIDYQFFSQANEPEVDTGFVAGQYWLKRESSSPYTVQGLYKLSDSMQWETVEYTGAGTSPGTPAQTGNIYIVNAPSPDGSGCFVLQDNPDAMGWLTLAGSSMSEYAKLYVSSDDPPSDTSSDETKKLYIWAKRSGSNITALYSYNEAGGGWVSKGNIPQVPDIPDPVVNYDVYIPSVDPPGDYIIHGGDGGLVTDNRGLDIYWWDYKNNMIYSPGSTTGRWVPHTYIIRTYPGDRMTDADREIFFQWMRDVGGSQDILVSNQKQGRAALLHYHVSHSQGQDWFEWCIRARTPNDLNFADQTMQGGNIIAAGGPPDTSVRVWKRFYWVKLSDTTTRKAVGVYEPMFGWYDGDMGASVHWELLYSL